MAQNAQQGNTQAVGAVDGAKTAAAPAQTAAPAAPAKAAETKTAETRAGDGAQARQETPLAQNTPNENVTLTPDAQRDLEEKKLEEQKKLQEQIDQVQQQIDDTKAQLEQAHAAGDKNKVAQLTQQLQGLEEQLGGLIDQANGGGHQGPAPAGEGGPNLIPPPAGGAGRAGGAGGGGGFNPYAFGNMGMGMPGGGAGGRGGLGAGNFATPADPSVNIPDYGKGANKAQIGEMLGAASKKYGIPENILKAVAWQESGWNSKALSFDGHHGKGVMQIDDRFHQFARTDEVFDPAKNIDYGAKYLAGLYKETGSWQGALKRYNGGSDYPPKVLALAEQQPWQKYT